MEAAVNTPDSLRRKRPDWLRFRRAFARPGAPVHTLSWLLVLLGLALRVARLDFQPLWWDEGYSAWFATHAIPDMVRLTAEDIHPPLYYALLHLWTRIMGPGPVSLRLLSVVIGVATIPVIFIAARRILGGRRPALLAAFLLAINPLHVYYSQEVRMYGLVALLSAGVLWAAWSLLEGKETRFSANASFRDGIGMEKTWFLRGLPYVLFTTLALYTQYYAIFLPLGLTLYALWRWRRDVRRLLRWMGLQGVVALLYLPWVLYAAPRLTLYVSQKVVQDADRPLGLLPYLARHLAAFIAGHLEGPLAPWWPLALLLLVPLVGGLVVAARRTQRLRDESLAAGGSGEQAGNPRLFLGSVLATALLLGWLISLRFPFFPERGERLLLLALPAFVMLAAEAIASAIQKPPASALPLGKPALARVGGLLSLAVFVFIAGASLLALYTTARYADDDYRPLIARTVEQGLPGDTVFCVYPWQAGYWRAYAAGIDGPTAVLTPSVEWGQVVQTALDDALRRGHVWFPAHLALGGLLETNIERHLGRRALPFANTWYGPGTRLSAWTGDAGTSPVDGALGGRPSVQLPSGEAIELSGVEAGRTAAPAANAVVPLVLHWRASEAPPDLAVSVRLTDDLGQIWGQNDYEPLGRMVGADTVAISDGGWQSTDRLGVLVPAGTPPGRYDLELIVALPDEAQPLPIHKTEAAERTSAVLAQIEVTSADKPLSEVRLPIRQHQAFALDNGLRFLGCTLDEAPLAPGDLRRVNLFWQAASRPPADYTAFVQLLGADGAPVAGWEAAPGAAYPTSQWQPGTLMRTQASFRPPAGLPDGRYRLIAGLYRSTDGDRAKTDRGEDAVSLGWVTIKGRSHNRQPPTPAYPADAVFGERAKLVGYTIPLFEVPPAPGERVPVTLHWQALGASDRPYTVFIHLEDADGQVWGNGDGEPGEGRYPTTGWIAGEFIEDEHGVRIAPDAPPGEYRLLVGLYDPVTGQRLTTASGETGYRLAETVTVR